MSMLAERKRKTKWNINPTKKPLWTTDSTGIKFGKELMEKMGWSAGKGLGVNEQGIQEPLKLSYKNDTKGMGFKGNDDDWIEQQDEFNELLNQLSNDNTSVIKISEEEKAVKSLEEKSKQSRARVHYQKFTRGKDLSRYSDQDLACILGTKKTLKEKSKTEGVTQIKSEVIGNCETSFGVTTINSGSIQDYFKKKWVTDKKSSNLSNMTEDKTEISNESCQKTNSCFVKTFEQSLTSEDEEETFEKRKYKSDFEEHLNINGTKTSDSEILESYEGNVKDKKKKREFQEINLEVKTKKRRKNSDDSNILANENHLTNFLNYEESKSLVNMIDSYNSVKKRKKEKTHFKLGVIEGEKNCGCIAENKRKMNHENNCLPEVLFAEKLCRTTAGFNLKEEITESKKKKKSKKKEPMEVNELKNEACSCFSILPLSSQNDEVTEFSLEIDSFKKKKRKEEKGEYLNKDIESKDCSCNEIEDCYSHGEDKIKVAKEEQLNGISERGNALDINTVKKKKRKNKKEKLEKGEETINCHTGSIEESNLEEELKEKNVNADEQENVLKIQSFRKKKNKKDKAEKLYEKEKAEFSYDQYKSVLKDSSQETNISKVIFSTAEQENEVEGESYQKKKKKKDKKEREIDNINCCGNSSLKMQAQENILEIELVKKKKKKKHRREKSGEEEKAKMEFNCNYKEKLFLEESSQETHINNINIASTKSELVKKKKSKKDKKEKSVENKGSKNKEEFCKHSTVENEVKIPKYEEIEKLDSEIVCQKMGSNTDRKPSAFHFPISDTMERDAGVHKHKIELLNERSADKFYPGQHTNNRIRRLICWFNVAGFKGSNLNSVTGYGFLTKYETNKFK